MTVIAKAVFTGMDDSDAVTDSYVIQNPTYTVTYNANGAIGERSD